MPSSSRPYQSRLLKFALGQYQRGLERHRRAMRQVSTAATWGAQAALYPVYVLFQVSRLVGRQLADRQNPLLSKGKKRSQSQASHLSPLVQASPLEMPLLTALADVRQWLQIEQRALLAEADATSTDIVQSKATDLQAAAQLLAQGIASDIVTQKLVVVDRWNTVWDILSDEQASRLRSQIAWLLTHFVPTHRRYFGKHRWRLPLAAPTEQSLPLAGAFLRLMGWVQTSAIARVSNLFAEAALIELPPTPPELLLMAQGQSSLEDQPVQQSPESSQVSRAVSRVRVRPTAAAIAQTSGAASGMSSHDSGHDSGRNDNARSAQNASTASSDSVMVMSDYVETTARTTAYLEHPLEKLLRLIDRALSWVEQQSNQLRHWWQRLMSRF